MNSEPERTQKILEDVIFEAYHTPGSSLLETDETYGPNNLHSLIAKGIRLWVLEGGNVMQTERKWPADSKGTTPIVSDKETLNKYFTITELHLPTNEKENIL